MDRPTPPRQQQQQKQQEQQQQPEATKEGAAVSITSKQHSSRHEKGGRRGNCNIISTTRVVVNMLWCVLAAWSLSASSWCNKFNVNSNNNNNNNKNHGDEAVSHLELWCVLVAAVLVWRSLVVTKRAKKGRPCGQEVSQQQQQKQQQEPLYWRNCGGGGDDDHETRQLSGWNMACCLVPSLLFTVSLQLQQQSSTEERSRLLTYTLASSGCLLVLGETHPVHPSFFTTTTTTTTRVKMALLLVGVVSLSIWNSFSVPDDDDDDAILFLLGIAYCILFMLLYGSLFSIKALHQVWTPGEWAVVVSLNTAWIVNHFAPTLYQQQQQHRNNNNKNADIVYLVARSGFLGTLLVCPLVNAFPWRWLLDDNNNKFRTTTTTNDQGNTMKQTTNHIWERIVVSVLLILSFVELHFTLLLSPLEMDQEQQHQQDEEEYYLPPFLQQAIQHHQRFLPKCLIWLGQFLMEKETSCWLQPITVSSCTGEEESSLSSSATNVGSFPRYYWIGYWILVLVVSLIVGRHTKATVWSFLCNNLDHETMSPPASSSSSSSPSKTNTSPETSRMMALLSSSDDAAVVTLTRKWFHGVAVVMFLPTTLYAPRLLALSYAIALSVLALVEGLHVRRDILWIRHYFETFLDPTKQEEIITTNTNTTTTTDDCCRVIVSHMSLIAGCAVPLFLALYLVEKEEHEENFTANEEEPQMQMKVCGLGRLWCYCCLSLVGIVGLGVGDAAAAIVGTLYSRNFVGRRRKHFYHQHHYPDWIHTKIEIWTALSHYWGRQNRTWVGSLAMIASMYLFVQGIQWWWWWCWHQTMMMNAAAASLPLLLCNPNDHDPHPHHDVNKLWWTTLLWMTVVEAYTSQLDNLVLPLVGMTVFLLQGQVMATTAVS